MSKFVFEVPSEMVAKATDVVDKMVAEELKLLDPEDQKAEAAIKANTEKKV